MINPELALCFLWIFTERKSRSDLYLVPNVRRIQTGIITERFPSSQPSNALKTEKLQTCGISNHGTVLTWSFSATSWGILQRRKKWKSAKKYTNWQNYRERKGYKYENVLIRVKICIWIWTLDQLSTNTSTFFQMQGQTYVWINMRLYIHTCFI